VPTTTSSSPSRSPNCWRGYRCCCAARGQHARPRGCHRPWPGRPGAGPAAPQGHPRQQRLDLTAKEFKLLALLLRRQGEVLSRTEIAEQVWDINFDSATNVIDVAVRRLRGKLDAPFERKLLHTVRGMGYVLEEREE
jgi:hypothetical protein